MGTRAPRRSREQEQERISRDQLHERLTQYGWVPNPMDWDLGEDFVVQIHDKGEYSGLSFYVQLKSTTDLDGMTKRGGYVSYGVDVADILHWEGSATPVLFFVWDISQRRGCWISIHDAISDLDSRRPGWREHGRTTVRIPLVNGTQDAGLCALRVRVAWYCFPTVCQGRTMQGDLQFVFPQTAEAQATRAALERHIAAGDHVEIDGAYIRRIGFKDWAHRVFGDIELGAGRLLLGPAAPGPSIPTRIDALCRNGQQATIPYVDLRVVKAGSEEATLSNQHQPIPLHLEFVIGTARKQFNVTCTIAGPGRSVADTREMLRFLSALARGCRLRITRLDDGAIQEGEIPAGQLQAPDPVLLEVVEKLCLIQSRTGCSLAFGPDWSLGHTGEKKVSDLVTVLNTGRLVRRDMVLTGRFSREALALMLEVHRQGKPIRLRQESDDSYEELLGVKVGLGPFRQELTGTLAMPADEFERSVGSMGPDDGMDMKLIDVEVAEEFARWLPKGGSSLGS